MKNKIFLDANILVYCFDSSDRVKKEKATQILENLWETSNGVLSLQVLNEFFVTVTAKLPEKMDFNSAKAAILDLFSWNIYMEDRSSLEKTLEIVQKYHLSFWDANIISSAILSQCHKIYSEDLRHDQVIEGVQIINPLL
ncbi:MAG: PIN domain-containing protein [Nitrospirae bacterium]|nr:PIN domain-containing protein [Nitrospirota bacterium]